MEQAGLLGGENGSGRRKKQHWGHVGEIGLTRAKLLVGAALIRGFGGVILAPLVTRPLS